MVLSTEHQDKLIFMPQLELRTKALFKANNVIIYTVGYKKMRKRRKTKNIQHSSVAFFYEMEAEKLPLLISLAEEHVGTRPGNHCSGSTNILFKVSPLF
jgi:hypothetical protein